MDDSGKSRFFLLFRHWPGSIAVSFFLVLVLLAWWNSSRYSERRVVYLGTCTLEVFSASSLLRLSFVNGHIANFGARTFYRHPNPRGKIALQPSGLTFRHDAGLWEVTMGFWHVVALLFSLLVGVGLWEWNRSRPADPAELLE